MPRILSCADSRIAPEYAFDSSRGDLFVCRVAGNFANDDTIASLEYGVAVLNSPLILVLGHDSCGAVDATIKSLKDDTTLPGHLPSLVSALAPAVKAVADQPGDKLANAIRRNVKTSSQNSNRRRRSSAPPRPTARSRSSAASIGWRAARSNWSSDRLGVAMIERALKICSALKRRHQAVLLDHFVSGREQRCRYFETRSPWPS